MEFDVLPGPPLAELARTTMARAFAAGPVNSLSEIPASIRAVLTCRCGGQGSVHS
jgi:hypothetical protein